MEREEVSRILADGYRLRRTAWAMQRAPSTWPRELARATTNSHEAISCSMVRTRIVRGTALSMLLFEATHSWCDVFSRAWWI
jgi:IS30 family transposase